MTQGVAMSFSCNVHEQRNHFLCQYEPWLHKRYWPYQESDWSSYSWSSQVTTWHLVDTLGGCRCTHHIRSTRGDECMQLSQVTIGRTELLTPTSTWLMLIIWYSIVQLTHHLQIQCALSTTTETILSEKASFFQGFSPLCCHNGFRSTIRKAVCFKACTGCEVFLVNISWGGNDRGQYSSLSKTLSSEQQVGKRPDNESTRSSL